MLYENEVSVLNLLNIEDDGPKMSRIANRPVFTALQGILAVALLAAPLSGCTPPTAGAGPDLRALDLSPREPTPTDVKTPQTRGASRQFFSTSSAGGTPGLPAQPTQQAEQDQSAGSSPDGISPAGEGFNVNLDNASLPGAVRMILGDVLKVSYVIDPKVQGTITLSTSQPVTKQELLKVLEAALQMNDASLLFDGKQYKVVPRSVAAEGGASGNVDFAQAGTDVPPGYGVTVLPLRHVKAAKMMELLDGFIARSGLVRASSQGNLLLLRGTAQERQALIGIAESFDVDTMRNQSAAIATLQNSSPAEMISKLKRVMQVDGDFESAARFEPLERMNAVLVLAPDKTQVREALTWIDRLDQETEEGTGFYVYRAQNTKASALAKTLNEVFGQSGSTGAPTANAAPAPAPVQGEPLPAADGSEQTSPMAEGQTPPATQANESAATSESVSLGEDVRITANTNTNSLLIRAPSRTYKQIFSLLQQIDKPSVQVLINVIIAEVTLNDDLRYGVEAYLEHGKFAAINATHVPLKTVLPGLNIILGGTDNPKMVLDALSAVTNVKVVSSPSVVTLDNQPATIKVADQVPVTTQQAISTQTAGAPIVNSIEYRDAGVILRVNPRVSETDLVTMDVAQELSSVLPSADSTQTTLTPTISSRSINSTIAVYSKQTVILGGLISSSQSNDKNSIPIVNRIPLIGDLFGNTEINGMRRELVVFITPRVMRDAVEASRASEEVRSRLKLLN